MIYIILFWTIPMLAADQVVLLDTTKEATLEWTRYPYGPQAQTPGWVEESFTNFGKGINWRSYVVCDVAYHNVNNWLWSPFIDRGPANRLYIEIQFTIRDCSLFPGNALSCKETFSLLYYEFDAATREPPPWQPDSYKLIARIAAGEGRFHQNNDVDINTEVKSIAVTKKGVYFAFRDQGACISVLAVKVYYITCPAVTENFAYFNETPTGKEVTIIEKQIGVCVDNAEAVESPSYLCKGDGKWTILTGGCKCKIGFEPEFERQSCKICPIGTFRSIELKRCVRCPMNSHSNKLGSSKCSCLAKHYRHPADGHHMPCFKPPEPPRNISVLFLDQSSVILTWLPPDSKNFEKPSNVNDQTYHVNDLEESFNTSLQYVQFRSDLYYHVVCIQCSTNVVFSPGSDIFNETKVTLTNLEPVTSYTIEIHSVIGQSYPLFDSQSLAITSANYNGKDILKLEDLKTEFIEITFITEASIVSTIYNLRTIGVRSNEVHLKWDQPKLHDQAIEFYEGRWFMRVDANNDKIINKTIFTTQETNFRVTDLQMNSEYGFQIRYKSVTNWGQFSNILYVHTHQSVNAIYDESMQMRIVASATLAVVLILILVIIATVLFLKSKQHENLDKKALHHLPLPMEYTTNEVHAVDTIPIVKTLQTNVTTPLFGINSRSYIDPHTYEDPNQAIREFAREIDACYITIEAIIGGGEFGDVCRGRLKIPPNFVQDIDVAIKTLKPGSSEKARCDFLTEASIMGQFDHPNVIYLQGVVTRSNPVMIITEYMENGSLDTFLRANDGKFQTIQLIGMLRGISSGMAYLSDMNYVHRDLAARNVLVNTQLICKIADFGLSREIENASDAYTTRGGKIPVRWTAPEAIAFRKFTSASDVWSYGVVLWEVMSYGERPYWNWSNQDVIKSIEKGYRLPSPMDCPEALYQLMLDCWQKQRTHRPTFISIVSTLDNLARQPYTLTMPMIGATEEEVNSRGLTKEVKLDSRINQSTCNTLNNGNSCDNQQQTFINIDQWLDSIKMSRYGQHFKESNLMTIQQIKRLTAQQLSDMGILLVGHQKKILHQARLLNSVCI